MNSATPLMRQYFDIKKEYPECLLFFQVGDFFELFFEDAQKASAYLGITLTQRGVFQGNPIPLCGVPCHTVDHYLIKLVRGGFRVALCEQLSPPQAGKVVERGVTQVLTPGTLTEAKLLDEKSAVYLAVVFPHEKTYGVVSIELLTGSVAITSIARDDEAALVAELARFLPHEIIVPVPSAQLFFQKLGYVTTVVELGDITESITWVAARAEQAVVQFVQRSPALTHALALGYTYLAKNQPIALAALTSIIVYSPEDFLLLDAATQRNLELLQNAQDASSAHTLFAVLDHAVTAMGSRMIKKWLTRPLVQKDALNKRLETVAAFVADVHRKEKIRDLLRQMGDLERVVGRIVVRRATMHDYRGLMHAVAVVPDIAACMQLALPDMHVLHALLSSAIHDDPTAPWLVKVGYHEELDRLRELTENGTHMILALERREQEATGINSLKVRYNGAHGYGIEITKANMHSVPAHYIRLQTLVNRERYTTQELKDLEHDLLRARAACEEMERIVFETVKELVEQYVPALKKIAQYSASIDALASFAQAAVLHRYVRPEFHTNSTVQDIIINAGRHPVVEARIYANGTNSFVPNTTELTDAACMWIITGPNMGGKSTYLRQVALICILAQIGSFVPATSAQLPLLDRIFTRIGASDNVAQGKSTFLVEMEETALICRQATAKSLVILDEVGRGTSTYDGLAIAQAVVEHLHTHVKARCLFATHYHELTALVEKELGIVAYYAASKSLPDGSVVLLHKIIPGIAGSSFGIAVARSAKLPEMVIARAQEILHELTGSSSGERIVVPLPSAVYEPNLEKYRLLAARLEEIDYDALSPKKAFDILWSLK